MAKLNKHSVLTGLQGSIGKELVFKQYGNTTVVSKYPDMSKVKPSPAQLLQRQLMKKANAYAQRVKRDAVLSEKYKKSLKPGESVFHKAKQDYFRQYKEGVDPLQ
jgi:hypothetical protein